MNSLKLILLAAAVLSRILLHAQSGEPLASVVVNSHPETANYVASPGMVKLPNGDYLASHDWQKDHHTSIYVSKDRGKTWSHRSDVPHMHWASLFLHNGAVYLLGVNRSFGEIRICRSTDNGRSWSVPTDCHSGILFADGQYHTAPVPVVTHHGRIWRSFENAVGNPDERIFESCVISAPADADLLEASSWQMTNRIRYDRSWGGKEWIEGNVVISPTGELVNVLRTDSDNGRRAAIVRIENPDSISFTPASFVDLPGGSVKFTIRYDSLSQRYWSLSNYIPVRYMQQRFNDPAGIRNTLALISSPDLRNWCVHKIVLQTDDVRNNGFQYADWFFDGDDIAALVRTACSQPDGTPADNFHNANYITFHRIEHFRDELFHDQELQEEYDEVYLFSYFTGNGEDGLHLAYSYDGILWKPLKHGASFLQPEVGSDRLMRDPSICCGGDGHFHMVWTTGWHDRIIGYSSSDDLMHWTPQRAIPVMTHEPTAKNAWAPELFFDSADSLYHILWASTVPGRHSPIQYSRREQGYNHRIYRTTTRDFEHFSPTELFFNPDFSVIDAAVLKHGSDYLLFLKNENPNPPEKNIRLTIGRDMQSPFPVEVSAPITGEYWAEGPSPLQIGAYVYVYFDKYTEGRYGAVRSRDLQNWEDLSDRVVFPRNVRHGTAFKVPVKRLNTLFKSNL